MNPAENIWYLPSGFKILPCLWVLRAFEARREARISLLICSDSGNNRTGGWKGESWAELSLLLRLPLGKSPASDSAVACDSCQQRGASSSGQRVIDSWVKWTQETAQ